MKEFAQNVEQLVDRVVSGDLALKVTQDADRLVSGFIRHFEVLFPHPSSTHFSPSAPYLTRKQDQ